MAFQQRYHPPQAPPSYTDKSHELYNGRLTYCTWNSLQGSVPRTAPSIIRTLESFPIVPNNLLIDDGWQSTNDRQMSAYGAQEYWLDGYKSLGDVISKAKGMGVETVGVWHTVLGYWGGISRSSETFKYVPFLTLRKRWGATYPIIHPIQVDRFFDTWYKQLSQWGVDFVKCDDMAEIEDMDSCTDDNGTLFPLRTVRTAYVEAIRRNVQKYFAGRIIWYLMLAEYTNPGAWHNRQDIYSVRTPYPLSKMSNLCDQVTIISPISRLHMHTTSTPIPLSRNSSPVSPSPISTCSKLIRSSGRGHQSPNKVPFTHLSEPWETDLLR
jgi:hypothetical protein